MTRKRIRHTETLLIVSKIVLKVTAFHQMFVQRTLLALVVKCSYLLMRPVDNKVIFRWKCILKSTGMHNSKENEMSRNQKREVILIKKLNIKQRNMLKSTFGIITTAAKKRLALINTDCIF